MLSEFSTPIAWCYQKLAPDLSTKNTRKEAPAAGKRFANRPQRRKRDFLRKVANRIDERFEDQTLDYILSGANRLILKPL